MVTGNRGGLVKDEFGREYLLSLGELYGVRAWSVNKGHLTAAFHNQFIWGPGVNTATCQVAHYRTGWQPYYAVPGYMGAWGACHWEFQRWNLEKKPVPHTEAPVEECTCGFYAYSDPDRPTNGTVKGVVRITGKTLIGTKGYRFEKGEIVALLDPTRDPDTGRVPWRRDALKAIIDNYPDVPLFQREADMFGAFPLTEPEK